MKKVKIEISSNASETKFYAEVTEGHEDGRFAAVQQFSRHEDALAWVSKWVDICKGMRDIYAVEFADYVKDDFQTIEFDNDEEQKGSN